MRPLTSVTLALALLTAVPAQGDGDSPLPPLTDPASQESLTGKFVWADLFTSDIDTSRRFYEQLFGWRWSMISEWPRPYGMFSSAGVPVAGLAHRAPPTGTAGYGRWVHYISVEDVAAAEDLARRRAGRILMPLQNVPDRGDFAVIAGPDEAIVGLMRSSSGDPPDFRTEIGEWLWFQLFTHEPTVTAGFYRSLAGYTVHDRPDTHDIVDLVLVQGDYARASIGTLAEASETRPTWLGFVRVADIGTTTARVRELGGEILYQSAAEISDLAIIADPNGATLGLLRWDFAEEDRQ